MSVSELKVSWRFFIPNFYFPSIQKFDILEASSVISLMEILTHIFIQS
jgi:hypothetical protein